MADPNSCSSASSPPSSNNFALESDDLSSLLHTLLHNSSAPSTSSTSSMSLDVLHQQRPPSSSPLLPANRDQFYGSAVFSGSIGFETSNLSHPGAYYVSRAEDTFPGAISSSMERISELDCESEDQDAMDAPMNPVPTRGSSKRTRAAEVHNLSEKRRRQRINEKMKALQKLIPNSNKTDKASMLDEAIEYLKQLQLQVQMLAMRNGSTLHPFYLPSIVPPVQSHNVAARFDDGNGIVGTSIGTSFHSATQDIPFQTHSESNQCVPLNQKPLLPFTLGNSISEPSLCVEPSPSLHHRPISVTAEPSTSIHHRSINVTAVAKDQGTL